MDASQLDHAERKTLARVQQLLDRQHAATVAAVTFGVAAGVAVAAGIALYVLGRSRRSVLVSEDPDAPLFV